MPGSFEPSHLSPVDRTHIDPSLYAPVMSAYGQAGGFSKPAPQPQQRSFEFGRDARRSTSTDDSDRGFVDMFSRSGYAIPNGSQSLHPIYQTNTGLDCGSSGQSRGKSIQPRFGMNAVYDVGVSMLTLVTQTVTNRNNNIRRQVFIKGG